MTVYVDDMFRRPMGRFGRMKMSHMIADTDEELHAMAAAIGMNRAWFQGDHYDVSLSRREKAVDRGALEVTLRTLAWMVSMRRKTGKLPTPEEADADRAAYIFEASIKRYGETYKMLSDTGEPS